MFEFDVEQFALRLASAADNNYLSRVPLYECIRRTLQEMIVNAEIPEDCRLPSDKDFARRLGVNTRTLGKALNELRNSGLLLRQRARGTCINVARGAGKAVAAGGCNQVGLVFDEVTGNTFQAELFVEIHRQLSERNLDILFVSSSGLAEKQYADVQAMFLKPGCCGCIVWSIMTEQQVGSLLEQKPRHFPLLILDKEYSGLRYDCVCYDVYAAAREAAAYYAGLGFQRALFLAPARRRDFMAVKIAGIQSVLVEKNNLDVFFHQEADVLDLKKERCFPVITANCESLHWLYRQYLAAGIEVKDLLPAATFCTPADVLPPLPVLQLVFPPRALGQKAVELLLMRLRGDQSRPRRYRIAHQACTLQKTAGLAV